MCIYTLEPETVDRFYESKFSAEECLNKMQSWRADLSFMFSRYQNFPSAVILFGPLAFYTHLSQEPPQQHRLALTVWVQLLCAYFPTPEWDEPVLPGYTCYLIGYRTLQRSRYCSIHKYKTLQKTKFFLQHFSTS